MTAKVVNMHHCKDWGKPGDVVIDRTSPYGNPFYMHKDTPQERHRVIKLFDEYIMKHPEFITDELMQAKRLGCWCSPKECHGDIICREILARRYIHD